MALALTTKVTWEGKSSHSRHALKMDSGTIGIIALLIDLLVDTERKGLVHMAPVGTYESFIWKRVSSVITNALGHLGGFGVTVLEIKELHPLHP